ncbi:MAG: bacterial transcriptional activator domain-containing protein [Roseiflexaceae bacterium]
MSNQPIDDADLLKFIQKERQRLDHISEAERQTLIEQRVRDVLAQERAEERQENEQAAELLSAELAYDPARERDRARETAKSAALLLIMLLLILLLIAAATGRTDILPIPGVQVTQTLRPYLNGTETGEFQSNVFVPTVAPGQSPTPDAFFLPYINRLNDRGSECSIGDPVSPSYFSQGLRYQWFQRALLKEMPAGFTSDPDWYVQGELLGRQVTTAIPFPTAQPFLSEPSAYYFRETGYSVSTQFLEFWAKCDGLPLLGYPISDLVSEVLTPGQQPYQVQYFERGRLEYHQDDPNRQVQFGLLGLIKSKDKNFQANIVMPPQPGTPVSLPIITPTPILSATSPLPPAATALPAATSPPPPAATAYPGP